MTRISFYVLQSETAEAKLRFSCQLVEKALNQGNRVMIHTANMRVSEQLDDLLWRFKPESYVPHTILNDQHAPSPVRPQTGEHSHTPVLISHDEALSGHNDVMVNLTDRVPKNFARYTRFAQIVNQEAECLVASRQLFAFFKERGYPIEVNKLKH